MPRSSLSLPFSGRRLREHRERLGLNQQGLADRCREKGHDITRAQVSRYETGDNNPTPEKLKGLVEVLGVEIDDLLEGAA